MFVVLICQTLGHHLNKFDKAAYILQRRKTITSFGCRRGAVVRADGKNVSYNEQLKYVFEIDF